MGSTAKPLRRRKTGGGKGIRTPGLLIANETLYQLSYTPRDGLQASTTKKFFQQAKTLLRPTRPAVFTAILIYPRDG
jgi:hypothetical protein